MDCHVDDHQPLDDDRDERRLLALIALADRGALRRFYALYFRRLQRFLGTMARDPLLIEEIINDTLLAVWRGAAAYRGESRVSTWVFGIAYRRALKSMRRDGLQRNVATQPPVDGDGTAIDCATVCERTDWVGTALAHLSAEHRMVVELTYFIGLSCEEVAAVVSCPVGTVKTRLHHARLRMRAALQRADLEAALPRGGEL